MKILFDQGVPAPLRESLAHEVATCFEMGWSELSNGALLIQAEAAFDLFVTTDKNLRYQQHIAKRKISIFVLPTTRWPVIKVHLEALAKAIDELPPSAYFEWALPEAT